MAPLFLALTLVAQSPECKALAEQLRAVEAAQRQPQSGPEQDRLRQLKRDIEAARARLGCTTGG